MGGQAGIGGFDGFGGLSPDERSAVLDGLAVSASDGEGPAATEALDELLGLIDTHRLARGPIRGLIVNDADADDVAQDVLIKVAAGITSFRGDAKFTTWLHTVARNSAIAHLRRSRGDVTLDEWEASPSRFVSSLIANRAMLRSAIDELPENYRAVVVLRDVEGHDYAAIARRLQINIGTVRSRLARGRALVARSLEPDAAVDRTPGSD